MHLVILFCWHTASIIQMHAGLSWKETIAGCVEVAKWGNKGLKI
jgi:hypothetical protein